MPKKTTFFKIALLLLIGLLFLYSCKKENQQGNDPQPVESFTNEFSIEEYWPTLPIAWESYDTDTIASKGVKLRAKLSNAAYEWTVNGVAYATRELIMDSVGKDTVYVVKYKVTKDGKSDSLIRTFVRVAACKTLVKGVFEGKDNVTGIIRTVEFDTKVSLGKDCDVIWGKGLTGTCASNLLIAIIGYRQIAFTSTTDPNGIGICFDPLGIAYYNNATNEIKLTYTLRTSSSPKKEYQYTGQKK